MRPLADNTGLKSWPVAGTRTPKGMTDDELRSWMEDIERLIKKK